MNTLIIAEAGVNHNGNIDLAKKLIDVAAEAGADVVKFQTFKAEKLVSKSAKKASYQISNMKDMDNNQFNMLKKLELKDEWHHELIQYCKKKKIEFLSTPFDIESIDFLYKIGIKLFKIPSGEITNYPYLQKIGQLNKKVIISTGMSNLGEIEAALNVLVSEGTKRENIIILHCNTEYPTPMDDVNLNAMITIKEALKIEVGFSDHTNGIEIPIAAVALGAKVIEKHFTLDKTMEGPDHAASLSPAELTSMVNAIRNVEKAMGNGLKQPSNSELKNKIIIRKSIHLAKNIKKGHIIINSDLVMKRPGDGISPILYKEIIGRAVLHNLSEDHKLSWQDLQAK